MSGSIFDMEQPTDEEVGAIIAQYDSDAREAVRALLAALTKETSHGYLRRRLVLQQPLEGQGRGR